MISPPKVDTPKYTRMSGNLLLIEDDLRLTQMVADYLSLQGFECMHMRHNVLKI